MSANTSCSRRSAALSRSKVGSTGSISEVEVSSRITKQIDATRSEMRPISSLVDSVATAVFTAEPVMAPSSPMMALISARALIASPFAIAATYSAQPSL